ncbi:hypothetical protein ACUH95_00745 [Dermabacteraceae bacterium P13101]
MGKNEKSASYAGRFIKGVTRKGSKGVNQDAWGHTGNFCWVIDGATRQGDIENKLVCSWVSSLNGQLAKACSMNPLLTLQELLSEAISKAMVPGIDKASHPSGTVSFLRFVEAGLEVIVLGDAGILVDSMSEGIIVLQDNRLKRVASKIREDRRLAKERGEFEEFHRLTSILLKEEDAARNSEGGFWVAGCDPEAAERALYREFAGVGKAVLMSDGVCNEMGRAAGEAAEFLKDLERQPIDAVIQKLRGLVLGRDSSVDDMTAVVCERALD